MLRFFFETASELILDSCTKEQLLKIADHYKVETGNNRLKDTIKCILKTKLCGMCYLIQREVLLVLEY